MTTASVFAQIQYPKTEKIPVVQDYFTTKITDNYRWLEDDKSAETANWVAAQNKVTFDYLAKIPFKNQIKSRMEKLWNYEKFSAPFKEGNFVYFYNHYFVKK